MKLTILVFLILLIALSLQAQESQTPKKRENTEWHWVIQLKFKKDKKAEAYEIIKNYWRPIESTIGVEQHVYEFETGQWDLIRIVKMHDGVSSLDWELSPLDIKHNKEFLKIAGSEEVMEEVRTRWSECLQEIKTDIVRTFLPE